MRRAEFEGRAFLPSEFPLPLDRPFTTSVARAEAGLTSNDLTWLAENGFIRRLLHGVYVANPVPDSIELRCQALGLVIPPDSVVCDRHAGWLHGAQMVLEPNEHLHLAPIRVFLPSPGRHLRNGLADSGERSLAPDDVMEINGLRVTSPLRTAWDLGRTRFVERSLAAMDQMLRLGRFTKEELIAGVPRFRGMRWVITLRATVPYVDGRAESPPESVLRLRWIQAHLPAPTPQVEVYGEHGTFLARLDIANPELLLGAEYDGDEWHSTPEQLHHDRNRRTLVEAETPYVVKVFRKEHLFGPRANAEVILRRAAIDARRRRGESA